MWWFKPRHVVAIAALAALVACGFAPTYGTSGAARNLWASVAAPAPDTIESFALQKQLDARLGPVETARYDLSYKIKTSEDGVAITEDSEITRYQLVGTLDYVLRTRGTGDVIAAGQFDTFASFSAAGSTISAVQSRNDALRRLMTAMADQLVNRLITAVALTASPAT